MEQINFYKRMEKEMQNHTRPFQVKLIHCGNRNLANPDDNLEKNVFFMPMGIFALAGVLRESDIEVEIIHPDIETGETIEEIMDVAALDAVGLDCHWLNQSLVVLDTAALLKKIKPDIFIFLGGFTASFFAGEILANHPEIDAIIRGDGEAPIVQLCRLLSSRKYDSNKEDGGKGPLSMKDVENLAYRDSNGEVTFNDFSYVASGRDMAKLDFAAVDLLRNWHIYRDTNRFLSKYESIGSVPQFILPVGRGCVYGCSFCGGNNRAQWSMNKRKDQVVRPIDSVISTIKKAIGYGFSLFFINFDFEGCDDYYVKLFNRVKEENIKIRFAFGSWGLPSKTLLDAMSECFIETIIEISPESGDLGLRKRNKDHRLFYTNDELEECLDYIRSKGNIKAQLYFAYFLPFETPATVFTSMEFITRILLKYYDFVELYYAPLSTDPASLMYLDPDRYDVDIRVRCFEDYLACLREFYILKKGAAPDMTVFKPRSMSTGEVNRLTAKVRLFNDLIFCFPESLVRLIKKAGDEALICAYLREVDIPAGSTGISGFFSTVEIKDILSNICREHHVFDSDIAEFIEKEYRQAVHHSTSKLRQFYTYKHDDKADKWVGDGGREKEPVLEEKNPCKWEKPNFEEDNVNFDFE